VAVDRRSVDRAPAPTPSPCRALGRAGFELGRTPIAPSDAARLQAKVSETRISRRELAAVAVALLLPIPLLAASGLRFPLPGAIERGAASLAAGGGGFDVAVVVDAASATSSAFSPAAASSAEGTAPADESFAVSSAEAPPGTGAASVRGAQPGETTVDTDSPTAPNPHTDDTTPPGGGDGGEAEPVPEQAAAAPVEGVSAEAGVRIDAETQAASVEVAVTDSGVTVDTGGAADLGPPLTVPTAIPNPPLPGLPLP
jgi:hypothetical protein